MDNEQIQSSAEIPDEQGAEISDNESTPVVLPAGVWVAPNGDDEDGFDPQPIEMTPEQAMTVLETALENGCEVESMSDSEKSRVLQAFEVFAAAAKKITTLSKSMVYRINAFIVAAERFEIENTLAPEAPEQPKPFADKESRELSHRAELLETLEGQHPQMQVALERVEISTAGMPSWEAVKVGLTPEVLDKALKMQEPTLVMVPPTTRQSKVEAINKHPAKGQRYDTKPYDFQNNSFWNDSKGETKNRWRVAIVEGAEVVTPDPKITDGHKRASEMAKEYCFKYMKDGLDVIGDADTYLTLMLKALAEGKPVDPKQSFTVLNAKGAATNSMLACGSWHDRVILNDANPDYYDVRLRLRSLVKVDVQQA